MNAIFRKRLSALIAPRDTAAKLSALVVLAASCVAWPAVVSAAENPPNGGVHKAPDTRKPTAEELEAWRGKIVHAPPEKKGPCYSASYPDTSWHEVPCQYKPHKAYLPRMTRGMHTFQVGGNGGTDFSAETGNGGGITEAEGSFDSATTSGETNVPTSGASTPESYTLQLNTAPFSTALCNGRPARAIQRSRARDGSSLSTPPTATVKFPSNTGCCGGARLTLSVLHRQSVKARNATAVMYLRMDGAHSTWLIQQEIRARFAPSTVQRIPEKIMPGLALQMSSRLQKLSSLRFPTT